MEPEKDVRQSADTVLIRSVAERLAKSRGVEEGLADILPLLIRFLGADFGVFLVQRETGWIVVGRGADEVICRSLPRSSRLVARAMPIDLSAVACRISALRKSRNGSPDAVALPVHIKRKRVGYGVFRTGKGSVRGQGTLHLLDIVGAQVGAFCENAIRCEQAEADRNRLFRANEELGRLLRFNESLHANGDADAMFQWLGREIERFVSVLGIEMVSLVGKSVARIGSAPGTKVPTDEERRAVSRKCSEALASRYRVHAPAAGFKVKRFGFLAASDSDRPGTARERVETPLLHAGQVVGYLVVEMQATPEDRLFIDRWIASAAGQIGLFLHKNADREKIRSLAGQDALTGLFNYRSFQEILDREFERFCRHGRNMSLMMIDLDNFKRINDTFGHQAGDHALCEVARILRANLRKTDYAFRYGGDEFVVLMAETDAERAAFFAQRIRVAVKREVRGITHGEFSFSTSIGIADCSRLTSADRGELLLLADAALYVAKNGGRDRIQVAPERLACAVGNVPSSAPRFLRPAVAEVRVVQGAV
ncbi:MAG: GGDEF domain-containing protein [bacterium]